MLVGYNSYFGGYYCTACGRLERDSKVIGFSGVAVHKSSNAKKNIKTKKVLQPF